jgi:RNA ligase (TIGR02306 family)
MRKLATIRTISSLEPIKKADFIELARVDGWRAVVKKGEFQVGDTIIYCEIDSFLPVKEEFEFLRKSCYKELSDGVVGFRLQTMRLRGQISQGLVLPISALPSGRFKLGEDVTEALGIIKYDPPIPKEMLESVVGAFPSFIKKTEEERIQNLSLELDELREHLYFRSEKLDGLSMTVFLNDSEFGVCGRNYQYKNSKDNALWVAALENGLKEKLESYGKNIAIQGELIGPGISENPYRLKEKEYRVYNVFDIDEYLYLSKQECKKLAIKFGLNSVPVVSESITLPETIDDILRMANGPSQINPETQKEGDVWVSGDGHDRISFKAISNSFLLEE